MGEAGAVQSSKHTAGKISDTVTAADVRMMMDRNNYSEETRQIIATENLLPTGLLSRLHALYPQYSGFLETEPFLFTDREYYSGLQGFREVVATLERHGIHIGDIRERELFVEVYRFKASRHVLNSIDWKDPENDALFQLVIPQPDMIKGPVREAYLNAGSDEERAKIASDYIKQTNPHDGKQLLNKPCMESEDGDIEVLEGSQHKYPQCQLIFDKTTQSCFAFCTYCFRHAQVRGDEDMFVQEDIAQVHEYLKKHKEVTDLLITGGDAGYLPYERMRQYIMPIIEDPELMHIRTIRLGTRMLTYNPEIVLSHKYDPILELFNLMQENGVQLAWMNHFSTPRELLNPSTVAAIRRLERYGVVLRSQSPIMNHISLFKDEEGKVEIERSAQNWIDLANILAMLRVGFHSMYCARPTGEHHYFTAPLADIEKISNLVFRSLSSLNRPSRYITMTTSAGKCSILGEATVNGEKALALKFNEARNMAWMDKVFLAKYDEEETRVDHLEPFDTSEFFFEEELAEIENKLETMQARREEAAAQERSTVKAEK